jgi:hypothetical protein
MPAVRGIPYFTIPERSSVVATRVTSEHIRLLDILMALDVYAAMPHIDA